jgi:hypothetical protein
MIMLNLTLNRTPTWLALFVCATLAACGKSADEKAAAQLGQAAKQVEQAGKDGKNIEQAVAGMMTALNSGAEGQFEPVDFRLLKDVLPSELPGFKVENSEGARNSAFGISVATYQIRFNSGEGEQYKSVEFTVTDPGSLSGPFKLAQFWLSMDIDKENNEGYERTSTVGGQKMFEKFEKSGKHSELTAVTGQRFIVALKAQNLPMQEAKTYLAKVNFDKLDGMKMLGKK